MTNRTIQDASDLVRVNFDERTGLVPVVVQHAETAVVLMLAWANREALEATMTTGQVHFWSRSRQELWRKGATSGNTLEVESLHADCDGDTILARARPAGPTCHTGESTCFGRVPGSAAATGGLTGLDETLRSRAESRPEGSYTVRLLDDPNLRLKKIGEETAELVAALATQDVERAVGEAADIVYHVLVALRAEGVGAAELLTELDRRAG